MGSMHANHIFEDVVELPNSSKQKQFTRLVGLDDIKDRLLKEGRLLLNPELLEEWCKQYHNCLLPLVNHFHDRAPFFVFGGDIGTGKTSLAESFGDPLARVENITIRLYRLSLNARGSGAVGEMTRLLSTAFHKITEFAQCGLSKRQKPRSAVILLIDEADALAQSREFAQMHHEDRAGVNAVIRGIDKLAVSHSPAIIVMCTNRIASLDPAIRRRAAATFNFERPNEPQRDMALRQGLQGINISDEQFVQLVKETGPTDNRAYGYTYSDLFQQLFPTLLLDAFPDKSIEFNRVLEIIQSVSPTPPFTEE